MLARLTPDQMTARLRESSTEELHAIWTGRDHRDRTLAGTEVARRKAAGLYRIPEDPDATLVAFLTREAHREHGSGRAEVARLLLLDRERAATPLTWGARQEAVRLLRALYPGSYSVPEARRASD